MKILGFDIETYREHFVFCAQLWDGDTKTLCEKYTLTDDGTAIPAQAINKIDKLFCNADYIVSFNGKRFDLPLLSRLRTQAQRTTNIPLKYMFADAQALINYDANNNPLASRYCAVSEWNKRHFDLLNNCLLRYSLKQWEMYQGLKIRELPYAPDAALTPDMKREIEDYCMYDVWATMQIFWKYGFDNAHAGKTTLLAYRALYEWWPKTLPFAFDRTSQVIASGILYNTLGPIPPKHNQPLALFSMKDFQVPDDVKLTIGLIAKAANLEFETTIYGITYGKGGAHYMVPGHHKNLFAFDFASLYPFIINHWQLLKTQQACEIYKQKSEYRLEIKHKKKNDPYLQNVDRGLKLFLNAPTGAFRMRSAYSTMFDPAAGEAMCYIGQLLISELAFSIPDKAGLVEVNTDSVFVTGDANVAKCREMITYFHDKYGLTLEEEYIPQLYARDVNNYIVYDKDGKMVGGKGKAVSDMANKASNIAVYKQLFAALIQPAFTPDWSGFEWRDFIVKYHKSSASKYATIGGEPMVHKNYYFMWTTRDCPNSQQIMFSRDLVDTKSGAIKARWGVWSQDIDELEQYAKYVDTEQYKRDLDVELALWNRADLVTTALTKEQRKSVKSFKDIVEASYI